MHRWKLHVSSACVVREDDQATLSGRKLIEEVDCLTVGGFEERVTELIIQLTNDIRFEIRNVANWILALLETRGRIKNGDVRNTFQGLLRRMERDEGTESDQRPIPGAMTY